MTFPARLLVLPKVSLFPQQPPGGGKRKFSHLCKVSTGTACGCESGDTWDAIVSDGREAVWLVRVLPPKALAAQGWLTTRNT